MKLGEHPVIGPLLAQVWEQERHRFCQYAHRRGVDSNDIDDLFQDACLRFYNLKTSEEMAAIANQKWPSEDPRIKLRDALTALAFHYLKYEVKDYHRNQPQAILMEPDVIAGLPLPQLVTTDEYKQGVLLLLSRIGPVREEDKEILLLGDTPEGEDFYQHLGKSAGLEEIEIRLIVYLRQNPEGRNQDFPDAHTPKQVSTLKGKAYRKILNFL